MPSGWQTAGPVRADVRRAVQTRPATTSAGNPAVTARISAAASEPRPLPLSPFATRPAGRGQSESRWPCSAPRPPAPGPAEVPKPPDATDAPRAGQGPARLRRHPTGPAGRLSLRFGLTGCAICRIAQGTGRPVGADHVQHKDGVIGIVSNARAGGRGSRFPVRQPLRPALFQHPVKPARTGTSRRCTCDGKPAREQSAWGRAKTKTMQGSETAVAVPQEETSGKLTP